MVDWELIGRAGTRYTVAYAGGTAAVAALTGGELLLLGLVAVGLLLLLFVAGGGGTVRMGTVMTNVMALGINNTTTDPAENEEFHETIEADLKLFFYAVGLVVFGFAGMVVLGSLG